MLPDIITDLQFRTKTSVELSMHKYRPGIFPNDTGYTDTQDIIQFQNNLSKPHQKILGEKGIFPTHTNLVNLGNMQINQHIRIAPNVVRLIGESVAKQIQDIGEDDEETS
ncbi:MAG: hypothetical protein ACE5GU_11825 [Candidatus Scalinduaceae bacterium]